MPPNETGPLPFVHWPSCWAERVEDAQITAKTDSPTPMIRYRRSVFMVSLLPVGN